MDVKVLTDDFIAIQFNTQSCNDICTFQPATVNDSNSQFSYKMDIKMNQGKKQQRRNVSLHFSANILNGKISGVETHTNNIALTLDISYIMTTL